jgi:hypothetical protein
MTTENIPACGFIEDHDGSIEWGSTWDPGSYSGPEPICVVYHLESCGAWIPFSAWTRDPEFDICTSCYKRQPAERANPKRCTTCKKRKVVTRKPIDEHDCDWIEKKVTLYHHESGGSSDGMPHVNAYAEPGKVPGRIWIAEGVTVADLDKTPLTDAALLAMGYRRVQGPTPDPFAGGVEGDTFHDERTDERVPDDDGEHCSFCDEQFVRQKSDIVVVDAYEVDDSERTGLYRPHADRWASGHGEWVAPLPHNAGEPGGDEVICPKCAAEAISDFGLHGLVTAWCEDPEAMPGEHREALLDAVRGRADAWIAGYPELRAAKVHSWFVKKMHARLGITATKMVALCKEAGYAQ